MGQAIFCRLPTPYQEQQLLPRCHRLPRPPGRNFLDAVHSFQQIWQGLGVAEADVLRAVLAEGAAIVGSHEEHEDSDGV